MMPTGKSVIFIFVAFLAVLNFRTGFGHDDDNVDYKDVTTLTTDTFEDFIEKQNHTLVVFYAPWCGHCKNLMPYFAEAATKLKESKEAAGVALAKVDATEEKDLGSKYEIRGFPTLKFFKKDGTFVDYTGGRTTETIISWVESMLRPAVSIVKEADIKADAIKEVTFVARVKKDGNKAHKLYETAAEKRRLSSKFLEIIADSNKDEVTVYRPDEEPVTTAIGSSLEKLESWIDTEKFPFFGPIDGDTYAAYESRGLEIVWFAGERKHFDSEGAEMRTAAAKFRDEYSFVWVDSEKFGTYIEGALGVSKMPGLVIQAKDGGRYKYPEGTKFVAKDIIKFITDVKAGKIEKFLKSEPIPETNDEPVKVVVGKNFQDMMFQKDKDVMLMIYAPYCGYCKRLEPIYNDLADKVAPFKHIMIAKMDGTSNESPNADFPVAGFPTLFWVKAGSDKPVQFSGDRTLAGLVKFMKEHTSKPFDLEVEEEKKDEKEEEAAKDEL